MGRVFVAHGDADLGALVCRGMDYFICHGSGIAVLAGGVLTSYVGLYFVIAANITVVDWSFGLPPQATWLATSLLVASLYLLVRERRAYMRLLDRSS